MKKSILLLFIVLLPCLVMGQATPNEQLIKAIQQSFVPNQKEKSLEDVKKGIKAGAKPDEMTSMYSTSTRYAVMVNSQAIVEYLLKEGGADVNYKDPQQQTHLHYIAMTDFSDMAKLLIRNGADVNAKNMIQATPLIVAIRSKKMKVALEILKANKLDLEAKNLAGETAMHKAANASSETMIEALIKAGANKDALDLQQQSAVHIAVNNKDEDMVAFLGKMGCNLNLKNASGRTPLVIAVDENSVGVTKALLRNGADKTITDSYGKNALDYAKSEKNEVIIKLLEAEKIEEDSELEKQLALNEKIMLAIKAVDTVAVVDLLDQGANPHHLNKAGLTPLSYATQIYGIMAKKMIEKGADVNLLLPGKVNLLHITCENSTALDLIDFFVAKGLDVNTPDSLGNTPLMYAAKVGNLAACQKLISLGAKLGAKNYKGQSAYEIAQTIEVPELRFYLKDPQSYRDDFLWKIRNIYPKLNTKEQRIQDWVTLNESKITQAGTAELKLFEIIRLSHLYEEIGWFDKAKEQLKKAVDLGKSMGSSAHAQALSQQANCYFLTNQSGEALKVLARAWTLNNGDAKPWDSVTLNIQNVYLKLHQPKGFDSKKAFYQRFVSAFSKEDDTQLSSGLVETYLRATEFYASTGAWDKALPLATRYVTTLSMVYWTRGEVQLQQPAMGSFHMLYGNPLQAEAHFRLGLTRTARELGVAHPYYLKTIYQLGRAYLHQGNFAGAELMLQEAKNQYVKLLSDTVPIMGDILSDFSRLYYLEGNYDLAFDYATQALSILNKYGTSSLADIRAQQVINNIRLKLRDIEGLEEHIKALILLAEQRIGFNTPLYHELTLDLAKFYLLSLDHKQFNKAEQLLLNTYNYIEKKKIEQANKMTSAMMSIQGSTESLDLLGMLYHEQKSFKKAEYYYLKSLMGFKGSSFGLSPSTQVNLARLYYHTKNAQVRQMLFNGMDGYLKLIDRSFPTMSEREKQLFFHQLKDDFNFFNYYAFQNAETTYGASGITLAENMYNYQLTTKALILTSSKRIRELIMNSGDKQLKEKYRQWIRNRDYLANMHLSTEELKVKGINLDSIKHSTNQLEKELSISSRDFEESLEPKRYTWQDVQQKLKANEAAIEIIRISHGKKVFYVALIITKTSEKPQLVKLPNGNHLEGKFLKYYRTAIEFKITDGNSYPNYWEPIKKALENMGTIKKVYVSPDGVYNQINLKSLYDPATDKFLIDEMKIEIVTRTDDLLTYSKPKFRKQGKALLLGKPKYKLDKVDKAKGGGERGTRMTRKISSLKEIEFDELPGTLVEVDSIDKVLSQYDWKVDKRIGEQAQEKAIKDVAHQHHIIHIATHGFFLGHETPDTSIIPTEERALMPIKPIRTINGFDPMLESGIVLAGVNNFVATDAFDAEDGVLTAYEVIGLDLSDADLVVLSACETGLGEVQNGEGVYGLQRALKVAGTDAILMSLWKVSDDATQKLMRAFYDAWLQVGDKRKAFEAAQLKVREEYPEPYYWAAFILVGN